LLRRLATAILWLKFWKASPRHRTAARPIKNAHTIWELVLHIAAWDNAVLRRLGGVAVALSDAENFPAVTDASETAWRKALADVRRVHEKLVEAVSVLPDSQLDEKVRARRERTTLFTTCSTASCSTSCIMPDKSRCSKKM